MPRLIEPLVDLLRPVQFRGKYRLLAPLVSRSGVRRARVFGATMQLDLSEWIQRNIFLGSYEREETRAFRRLLKPGDTVVDVGANVGYFTALAAALVGERGRVLAIEPSPYAFARLTTMIDASRLQQCRALNIGLSDAPGELSLYLDPAGQNHTPSMVAIGDAPAYAQVPVRTLDQVLADERMNRVDLMKLDVEGHEPAVLAGAAESLRSGRIHAIVMELNRPWLTRAGSSPTELLRTLETAGLAVEGRVDPDADVQNVVLRLGGR